MLRSAVRTDELLEYVMTYARETTRGGRPLSEDPDVRDLLVDLYVESQVTRLLHLRNFAYRAAGRQLTYEAPQAYLHQKRSALSKARAVLDIMGPRALVDDPEWPWPPATSRSISGPASWSNTPAALPRSNG